VRARDALALLRTRPDLRRYLLGVSLSGATRRAVVPFVIVMMRRVVGFSDAQVISATIAFYAGGLASLYLFGRAVDRVGPAPIFRWTALGMAALFAALLAVRGPGPGTLAFLLAFFFLLAALTAGFGVADTHVLFELAPAHAPAALLVVADVGSSLAYGLAPLLAGVALDRALASGVDPLLAYRSVFAAAALLAACAWLPLRGFRRGPAAPARS
jgi:predicted MFS family arabinose efflux permease